MIQESKWTIVDGQAKDTHIVCVQHPAVHAETTLGICQVIQVVSKSTATILQKCVIPQPSEKVKI